jgi:glyoxylase-like metal-dependent hydrolase (beta-lactamase superfamily II)
VTTAAGAGVDPDPGLQTAAQAGYHRISLPTPFAIGAVNTYLIDDDPLTLIDVGPNFGTALDALERGLDALGHRLEDLGLILITHQHLDHVGLLEILVRRSGAEVAAFGPLAPYLADYRSAAVADDAFAMAIMRRHGAPEEVIHTSEAVSASFRQFGGAGAAIARPLSEDDAIALRDRTLHVHHRPGHSPSDLVFYDDAHRLLITGDHLLARVSSNPLVSRPLTGPALDVGAGERPHALVQYIASMRATQGMDVSLLLGGHGPTVDDHRALIDHRLEAHAQRADVIAGLLAEGRDTAYAIAGGIWGNVAVTQAYLTISEVLGHLDLLIGEGRAREHLDGPVTRFTPT